MNFFTKFLLVIALAAPSLSLAQSFPDGCVSKKGFSTTTGQLCAGVNTTIPAVCTDLKYFLNYGSRDAQKNGEVTLLQKFLISHGYMAGTVTPTGNFSSGTFNAVKRFQLGTGLATTTTPGYGQVGKLTRAKIKEISCGGTSVGGNVSVVMSVVPVAQNIIAGGSGITFANIQFDASASGEDVKFSSIMISKDFSAGSYSALSGCQLFDGTTALNTGANTFNPKVSAEEQITLDQALNIVKGKMKTLSLKCNVSSSATGSFNFSVNTVGGNPSLVGAISQTTVTPQGGKTTSQTMTISSAGLTVATSSSSPAYKVVTAGSTDVVAGILRFSAMNEAVILSRVGLKLTSGNPNSVIRATIWDGQTQLGSAIFAGSSKVATSTLKTGVVIPKNADKDLTIKVDLAQVGTGQMGTEGDLIAIDYNAADKTGTQGVGSDSGSTINATGGSSVSGVRLFKSYPTIAKDSLSSSGAADGELLRFKVSAQSSGDISLNELTFAIATSTITGVTNVNLFGYTDSGYSSAISGFTSGKISTLNVAPGIGGRVTITPSAIITIPAGATYYFKLAGTVAGVTTGSSVAATLLGDSVYAPIDTAFSVIATSAFVWSPNTIWRSSATSSDWTNGYGIPGLSSSGLIQMRSSSLGDNSKNMASVMGAFTQDKPIESVVVAQEAPVFSYNWARNLEIGSGYVADVVALQKALTNEGVFGGEATGGFYNQTYLAVKAFQAKYGIDATGFVGPTTRTKLNSLYGSGI